MVFDVGFGACFQKDFDAGDEAVAGCIMQRRLASASGAIIQGLVNVTFWGYWTSPYSSHYRPYT